MTVQFQWYCWPTRLIWIVVKRGLWKTTKKLLINTVSNTDSSDGLQHRQKNNIDIDKAAQFLVQKILDNEAVLKKQEKDPDLVSLDSTGSSATPAPGSTSDSNSTGGCCGN
mmetsp:Transcript_21895/g.32533  ORF Transcript_21895/g.32533 Transcript_21895/m.32533 type:complete len:111 (-) Transcript_21895:60-392(-)